MPGDLKIRSQLALAERRRRQSPHNPELRAEVDQLRAAYNASALADHIKRVVDSAPPLSDEQISRLATLLGVA